MTEAFLRIPPFPGHRAQGLTVEGGGASIDPSHAIDLAGLLRKFRVGGAFWANQPTLPDGCTLLLVPDSAEQCREMVDMAASEGRADECVLFIPDGRVRHMVHGLPTVDTPADPWHLVNATAEIWAGADNEIALVAVLERRPVRLFGSGRYARCDQEENRLAAVVAGALVDGLTYRCPFTEEAMPPAAAIKLLGSWRALIDRNRKIGGIAGVAGWKRTTVDPLLWNGSQVPEHIRNVAGIPTPNSQVIAWKSRTSPSFLSELEHSSVCVAEIEDGFIRGPGLGANCVPPLSVVVDGQGVYFDPSAPSDLEVILQSSDMCSEMIERAAKLRERIAATGISKYGIASEQKSAPGNDRRRILVVGQVEDDRSVMSGGAGQTNLELLTRARKLEPDAWIIYRPHPDVDAGHRKGHIPDEIASRHADEIDRESAIAALIGSVDGLHCITSLAGFEALMHGKPVTTHGVPFYAGWGLTNDLADIPARRSRQRTLDELVAATLILYPRYLDPVTWLPCPPEILVERIANGEATVAAPLSGVRKLQGKLKLALRGLQRNAA